MVMAALFTIGRNGLFAVTSFALGASIALELAVVISVDHPYAGRTVVEPNALRNAVQVMERLPGTEGLALGDSHVSHEDLLSSWPREKHSVPRQRNEAATH